MKPLFFSFLLLIFSQISFSQLIQEGSVWKYLDDGSNQGTAWRMPGFDDSGWSSGPAQLGYGDGDEATVISYGNDPNHKYITYYFRKTFDVTDPNQKPALSLGILRDDGAVVYINGTEVARSNMPSGTITYLTYAAHTVSGGDEDIFFNYQISSSVLQAGTNTIAVEIHQRSQTSSDVSFDLKLDFADPIYFKKEPYLLYAADNSEMLVLWQTDSTRSCTFEYGTDTTHSQGQWVTTEYGDDHQHKFLLTGLSPATKYYYRVGCNDTYKEGSFVSGPDDDATGFTFYAYGDTRSNPTAHDGVAERIVQEIEQSPETQTFIVSSGDLVADGDSETDWQEQFFSSDFENIRKMMAELPYLAAVGNHEGQGALFEKYFPYPMYVSSRFYYSFDYGPAHFTVVDQFTNYQTGSQQYDWIVNDISASNKKWKIFLFHEPGWSADGGHGNNTQVQQLLQPLFEQYGIRLVITGHNHYYARAVVNGVHHITTGGGGAPLYNPNPNYDSIVKVSKSYHYCKIKIDNDTLTFTATKDNGTDIETFTIVNINTGTAKHLEKPRFKVYSQGKNIKVENINNIKGTVALYDNYGRVLFKDKINGFENTIHVKTPGIYFVRITNGNKIVVVKKLFVK